MPFGLVGSKNREVPMANERVEQAMRVRNLTRHYGRVRHAQPATDHGEPTDHMGMDALVTLIASKADAPERELVVERGRARVAARAHCAALAGKRGWSELDDLVSCEVTVYAAVENSRLAFLYHLDMAPSPHRDRALAAWAASRPELEGELAEPA